MFANLSYLSVNVGKGIKDNARAEILWWAPGPTTLARERYKVTYLLGLSTAELLVM